MGVRNAYPSSESASKMRTLRQKVGFEASKTSTLSTKVRQKCVPLGKKSLATWQKWQPFSEKGKDEDQSFGVLGRHPETRAESTISTSLEPISAVERTDGLPWVDLGVGGWPAERQQNVWVTNMRQKRAPFVRKCVRNAYPYAESRRRIEGRPRGVAVGRGQKCAPFNRKCVENATL